MDLASLETLRGASIYPPMKTLGFCTRRESLLQCLDGWPQELPFLISPLVAEDLIHQ